MARQLRNIEAGMIYHVLNRGNGRRPLFSKDGDYQSFLKLLAEALGRFPVDLLAWCLMNNHWHLLLRPRTDDALSRMMGWLTVTHARRHHMHYPNPGTGHLYQGRFKSFPVQSDEHFLTVARYIHGNPLRADLVKQAGDWRWSDLAADGPDVPPLAPWPVDRPRGWMRLVNTPMVSDQAARVRNSVVRGTPFGEEKGVTLTFRQRGKGRGKGGHLDFSAGLIMLSCHGTSAPQYWRGKGGHLDFSAGLIMLSCHGTSAPQY